MITMVIVVIDPVLSSNLAAGAQARMDVSVGGAGAYRPNKLCKFPWSNTLGRWSNNVRRIDNPGHGPAGWRAGRLITAAT